jgi:hypothetical protein
MIEAWSEVSQVFKRGKSGKESQMISSMFVEVGQWRREQHGKKTPLGLLSAVLHPFRRRPPRGRRKTSGMGPEQSDLSLLSSLPVFDGRVADTHSCVWSGGHSGVAVCLDLHVEKDREEGPLTCL